MIDSALLSELLDALDRRRESAREQAQRRKEAFAASHPEYQKILEEYAAYPALFFGAIAKQSALPQTQTLKKNYAALKKREARILKDAGLPENAFAPRYTCEKCSDTGYIGAKMCTCLQAEYNRARAEKSGLGPLFEQQSFASFDPERIAEKTARESMRETVSALYEYAKSFTPRSSENLLFVGGTGVGKTHLSSAIGKVVLENGYDVLYDSAANLIGAMESERFKDEKPRTERIFDAELLILDDLGTELSSQNTASFLFQIINSRLIAHRPTILSTNLKPKELEVRYGERMTSRLLGEFAVYLFSGEDQRRNG